ncbi:hypothetical protein [Lewinella sp. LCG006]|uniref:hypothetical protein n=1 Tax=Lewinella sp. LCG006 TaxID=3231911 RepID=UPI00346137C1
MEDLLAAIVIGIVVVLFLYYGYKDDFRRDPKEFGRTIFGVLLEVIGWFFEITRFFKKSDKE